MRQLRRLVSIFVVGIVFVSACGSDDQSSPDESPDASTTDDAPRSGGELVFAGQQQVPVNLDPLISPTATGVSVYRSSGVYWYPIFGALVYEDWESASVEPWMAESLEIGEDASQWILTLRDGINFTDGTKYDAEAVKFSWELIGSTETSPLNRAYRNSIKSLDVVDPLTLEINLLAPNAAFDFVVARTFPFVLSPAQLQADPDGFGQAPIGAGPFMVDSWDPTNGEVVLVRNEDYWDSPRPYLDGLTIKTIRDDAQRYNTFITGDVQIANETSGAQLDRARADGVKLLEFSAPFGGAPLIFNTKKAPFDNRTARLALMHAIDMKAFQETVFGDAAFHTTAMFHEGSPFLADAVPFPEYDPEVAQELFDEYRAQVGEPMDITFTYAASPLGDANFNFLTAQLSEYQNVSLRANVVDSSNYVASLFGGDFDFVAWNASAADPLADFNDLYRTGGRFNLGGYSNSEVDQLLDEAGAAATDADRAEIYVEIQRILVEEDAVASWGWQLRNLVAVSENVGDAPAAVNGIFLWDRVWLED